MRDPSTSLKINDSKLGLAFDPTRFAIRPPHSNGRCPGAVCQTIYMISVLSEQILIYIYPPCCRCPHSNCSNMAHRIAILASAAILQMAHRPPSWQIDASAAIPASPAKAWIRQIYCANTQNTKPSNVPTEDMYSYYMPCSMHINIRLCIGVLASLPYFHPPLHS